MPLTVKSDCADLVVAESWVKSIGLEADPYSGKFPLCVWSPDPQAFVKCPESSIFCWHVLHIHHHIDRYFSQDHPRLLWSPWGTKSGPNFQFFQILKQMRVMHTEPWNLIIEPDTIPTFVDISAQVSNQIRDHEESWVVGGHPHESIRPKLGPELWNHLNGAGLFHVGDLGFQHFCEEIWIPSLLQVIQRDSRFAYDCLTSPEIWQTLSPKLRSAWMLNAERFNSTEGILNLSTEHLTVSDVIDILGNLRSPDSAWMIHAKGALPEWINMISARMKPIEATL
jgi:hypothetical protein